MFLAQLLAIIAFLLCEVLLQTDFLAVPLALALRTLAPARYPPGAPVSVHPYIASGLLFVAVTTLVLFFATGMYTEKIGYANRWVPCFAVALSGRRTRALCGFAAFIF